MKNRCLPRKRSDDSKCTCSWKNRNVVKMNLVTNTGHPFDGLLFADGDRFLEEQTGQNTIDMIYYPDVNEYNGTRTLQAIIKNYKFR